MDQGYVSIVWVIASMGRSIGNEIIPKAIDGFHTMKEETVSDGESVGESVS